MFRSILKALISFLILSFPSQVLAQPILVRPMAAAADVEPEDDFVPGEVIVKFKSTTPLGIIQQINARLGAKLADLDLNGEFQRLKIPLNRSVQQMVQLYTQDSSVEYAEPNYIARAFLFTPNDTYFPLQWNFDNPAPGSLQMQSAWDITGGSASVVVAVVDTGVAYENYTQTSLFGGTKKYFKAPDLSNTNFVAGTDFVNNDSHPNDDEGHGTHVAGTIAQSTNNAMGVAGIAYNTSIMPVKVLSSNGSGTYANVASGIRWAADHGAKVINMSLGGSAGSSTLLSALQYAYNKGVTIVCAAGNDGQASLSYPAAYDQYCIAVGATRFDQQRAWYSNYGASLDVVAPGGDNNVDQNGDSYADGVLQQTFAPGNYGDFAYYFYQGTSMATPHVSGIAALLIAQGNYTTPAKVREAIQNTAKDLGQPGFDTDFGWGLVNAYKALTYNTTPNTPPVADPKGPYNGTEDVALQFDGTASYDVNGDSLTYAWNFGDGQNGSGASPQHTYTAGGNYTVTLVVNDAKANSQPVSTTASIIEVNDAPVSKVGGPYYGLINQAVSFNGSGSFDSDGTINSYDWNFGDGSNGSGQTPTHAYAAIGDYTVTLTVTDNSGAQNSSATTATITTQPVEVTVFEDSFEVAQWNGLWSEDSQNDWYRSNLRSTQGSFSAAVDGFANDSQLISSVIDLKGKTNVVITFKWYITSTVDSGEYLAFDYSTNGGQNWTELKRLRGDVDPENQWQSVSLNINNINNLKIRFRGKMSLSNEIGNVDEVKVVGQ